MPPIGFAGIWRGRMHYAWIVLAVMFSATLAGVGVRAAPGVMIVPLQRAFGWDVATVSGAISLNIILLGATGPFLTGLIEVIGLKRTILACMAMLIAGTGLSNLMTAPWQMFLTWGLMVGIGSGAGAMGMAAAIANRWFAKRNGLAMGLLTAANAAGQLIFLPLLAMLAQRYGWRGVSVAVTLAVLMAVTAANNPFGQISGGGFDLIPGMVAAALLAGIAVANRRAYVASIRDRAEQDARRQVDEERLRIARELHDVVAHTMATINVQAGVAAHVLPTQPEAVAEALQAIKTASKEGLRELRAILNVLRQADDADPTQPAPGTARLEDLIAGARRAGLETTFTVTGDPVPLPSAVDLAAYRVMPREPAPVSPGAAPAGPGAA